MDEFSIGCNGWSDLVLYHKNCGETIPLLGKEITVQNTIDLADKHKQTCND